jgi:hypothetical protein
VVQLAAYEAQYQCFAFFEARHDRDNMDTALSNVVGAMSATITACLLSVFLGLLRKPYYTRLLHRAETFTPVENCLYSCMASGIKVADCLRLGRKSESVKLKLEKKAGEHISSSIEAGDAHSIEDDSLQLDKDEENVLVEAIIGSQGASLIYIIFVYLKVMDIFTLLNIIYLVFCVFYLLYLLSSRVQHLVGAHAGYLPAGPRLDHCPAVVQLALPARNL